MAHPVASRPELVPLPATVEDLMRQRIAQRKRSIIDIVEEIHLQLWDKEEDYIRLLNSVWNEQAVEGSVRIDRVCAAEMVRDYAQKRGDNPAGKANLATIVKALGVILKRYRISPKQRRAAAYIAAGENPV